MRVHNLTDIPTEVLNKYGHIDQQIVVGTELCAPGGSVEVGDTIHLRSQMEHLVSLGALAVGALPPSYASAKAKKAKTADVIVAVPIPTPETALAVVVESKKFKKDA